MSQYPVVNKEGHACIIEPSEKAIKLSIKILSPFRHFSEKTVESSDDVDDDDDDDDDDDGDDDDDDDVNRDNGDDVSKFSGAALFCRISILRKA